MEYNHEHGRIIIDRLNGITKDNHFITDTNDSDMWKKLKFPLPKPLGKEWKIYKIYIPQHSITTIELISYGWW